MKRIVFFLLLSLFIGLLPIGMATAQPRLVGGDLSMVPAYEKAGDQWLDASGSAIADLLAYVRSQGWTAVRVRLFVDPTQDSDPSVCQDLDYVMALGKRVKDAGLRFMLDLHFSDTWADPSTQKIPASWTSHTRAALASQLYAYTHSVVSSLIAGGATPDYVQIGNEITYGLLWDTTDGRYPSSSSQYVSAGYCPTWSATYSDGISQWQRTASLLNNAAHGVRQSFADSGFDSTQVRLVVHTEMGGATRNGDNFYRHLRTAGFDNYDVIGLSYYPFWHGPLTVLGNLLSTLKKDFGEKEIQIVETAWYNNWYPSSANYTIAQLNADWTANAQGQVNFLRDLIAYLESYAQVTGLYYWMPEECGNGYSQTVMRSWQNRGLWQNGSSQRHALLVAPDGTNPVALLSTFLHGDGIKAPLTSTPSQSVTYDLSGRRTTKSARGLVISSGRKVLVR
ncbi:MAG: glycosyl hydrolase 53 family protein [Bacteroidaceae bacterium]|nr:glycosyl hydrolase 53 family protein [Bacteroidaceae bacterium]